MIAPRDPGVRPNTSVVGLQTAGVAGPARAGGATSERGAMPARPTRGVHLPVLMYHHVGPLRPNAYPGGTVTPAAFERQIRWMAWRGYVGIRASQWIDWQHGTATLPARPVLITLDDAYADIAEHALPVLARYGFGATVYVVTQRLGGTNTWDEQHGWATLPLMSADQITACAARGVELGAHTRTHPDLTTLSDAQLHDEIAGSADDLTVLLGVRPRSFAYPHGRYDQRAVALAQDTFELALTVDEGLNDERADHHRLRRAEVRGNDTVFDLECRLRFGTSPVRNAVRPVTQALRRLRERRASGTRG